MTELTRVSICIPLYGGISSEWFNGFNQLIFKLMARTDLEFNVVTDDGQPLSLARNKILRNVSERASKSGWEPHYLLWLDSDNIISSDDLMALLADDCDIVSALYLMRKAPHRPVVMRSVDGADYKQWVADFRENELQKAEIVGMGCCIMKWAAAKKMMEKFDMPFEYVKIKSRSNEPTYLSEDIVFCDRARSLGMGIWLDSRVHSSHVGGVIPATGVEKKA
jgi:glycosyltransferase involved in cell wall biosynthesis